MGMLDNRNVKVKTNTNKHKNRLLPWPKSISKIKLVIILELYQDIRKHRTYSKNDASS